MADSIAQGPSFSSEDAPFTLLDRYPATSAGHVKFLEWILTEVGHAVRMKRGELGHNYSIENVENTVRGIKWNEARVRLAGIPDLSEEAQTKIVLVLDRELHAGTIEQIETLLKPAVWKVRDSLEQNRLEGHPGPFDSVALEEDLGNTHPDVHDGQRQDAIVGVKTGGKDPAKRTPKHPPAKKAKRSTEKGEARLKLISALTKHHQYADGGCLNLEPVGNNPLARLAGVADSSASDFFKKEFGGHRKYRAICGDSVRLVVALKLLNREFSPRHLYGSRPPVEDERDDEK